MKRKEIGSILEIDARSLFRPAVKEIASFPFMEGTDYRLSYFNTGRAAIELLLKTLRKNGRTRAWMPAFCCSSVLEAAQRAGIDVGFYPVGRDLSVPNSFFEENPLKADDVLYVVNFFGKEMTDGFRAAVDRCKAQGITVVEDLTLSLFSSRSPSVGFGDYVIGSIRKWLPMPDGAFLASKEQLLTANLMEAGYDYSMCYLTAQMMKAEYLKDSSLDKTVFLDISNEGMRALFSDYAIREMSSISKRVLLSTDFEDVARKRNKNYDTLYELLNSIDGVRPLVKRTEGACPLGMIVCVEERDALFKHLVANNVYCNIHWRPNDCTKHFADSSFLAEHCLTIPCDQRYGPEDMEDIYCVVSQFFNTAARH